MTNKAEEKALELSEEVIREAISRIVTGIEGATLQTKFGWKTTILGCASAACMGIAGYFAASSIHNFMLTRKYRKQLFGMDRDGDFPREHYKPVDDSVNNEDAEEFDIFTTKDPVKIVMPKDLDNDPELVNSEKPLLDKLVKDYKYSKLSETVNPSIQIVDDYSIFDEKVEQYREQTVIYIASDDIAVSFDEAADKFFVVEGEDVYQGYEFAADNDAEEVFVANHDKEIVYDIQVDTEHTLEEILDDANQEELARPEE